MKKLVLITNQLPRAAFEILSRNFKVTWNKHQLTENQLRSRVGPYHALLTTLADPITRKVLVSAPKLQCVANYAVGYNNIDLKAASELGIQVTNTPDVLTEATADIAWALILSCARRLPEGEKMVRTLKFKGWHPMMLLGLDLVGKTLGLYGFGRIGQAVARRGTGWNMKVIYHQRHQLSHLEERRMGSRYVPFKKLLELSDILCVHAPLTPETRHRFTLKEFKQMRPNALFINTARGAIHDERDLALAVRKGIIASAGLDVYEREPKIDPGLLNYTHSTLLPHLGSATVGTRDRMAVLSAENISCVLSGRPPKTPVLIKPIKN